MQGILAYPKEIVGLFNLQRIIYPVEPHLFADRHLGTTPLLVMRQSPEYFVELFGMADLAALIDAERLRPPEIRMTKHGEVFRTETIANTLRAGRYVLSGKAKAVRVWQEYHAGATVILQSLHRHWPPLRRLCDLLGDEWLSQAQTNVYFTPAGGRGFTAHADGHDVFVLHLSGTKSWTVYQKPSVAAGSGAHRESAGYGGFKEHDPTELAPLGRFVLHPGDLLYLPRGYVHEAAANAEPSLHVTLGLAPHPGTYWMRECIAVWCLWLAGVEVVAVLRGDPRWPSLVLLMAGSIALGLNGGLHFLAKRSRQSLVAKPIDCRLNAVQHWVRVHVFLRVFCYVACVRAVTVVVVGL